MRVTDNSGLEKIRNNLREFSKEMADPSVSSNASEIAKRLAQYKLNADAFVNAFSATIKT